MWPPTYCKSWSRPVSSFRDRITRLGVGQSPPESPPNSVRERMERLTGKNGGATPRECAPKVATRGGASAPLVTGGANRHASSSEGIVIRDFRDHIGSPMSLHLENAGSAMSLLGKDRRFEDIPVSRALFLDTETTGLGGAGRYIFLIGVAWFEDEEFRVRQFFMPTPAHEVLLLEAFDEFLRDFDALITFNGKTYDLHALEDRYILSRVPFGLASRPHLDVLHPARRVWGQVVSSCRLSHLEAHILGRPRQGDMDGSEVPLAYFDWLHTGNESGLESVFSHNVLDLFALRDLLAVLVDLILEPGRARGEAGVGLGKLFAASGDFVRSKACLEGSLESPLARNARYDAARRLADLYRREGRMEEAAAIWESLACACPEKGPAPLESAARYHEHNAKDPARALILVEEALTNCAVSPHDRERFLHRRERLLRKIALAEKRT